MVCIAILGVLPLTNLCDDRLTPVFLLVGRSVTPTPRTSPTTSTRPGSCRDGNPLLAPTPRSSSTTWRLTILLVLALVLFLVFPRARSALPIFSSSTAIVDDPAAGERYAQRYTHIYKYLTNTKHYRPKLLVPRRKLSRSSRSTRPRSSLVASASASSLSPSQTARPLASVEIWDTLAREICRRSSKMLPLLFRQAR